MSKQQQPRGKWLTGLLIAGLALGWGAREAQFASAQGKRIQNGTLTAGAKKLEPASFEGKETGRMAVYLDGETPSIQSLHVGRFVLNPGAEPHPPHKHAEEELLIVTRGQGEVLCAGKKTNVRGGAVMYCDPNVEHGITNTSEQPLEFYWVKYLPKK